MIQLIQLMILVLIALFMGYFIGVRRERGRHQLLAELEATQTIQRKRRAGIKLQSIRVRR